MSVTVKALIQTKFASDSDATEYTTPADTKAIIDKFTATNTDSGTQTLTVNLVPDGGTVGSLNVVTSAFSLNAGESADLPELKNHVLEAGDFISVVASVTNKIVIRASGREVTLGV